MKAHKPEVGETIRTTGKLDDETAKKLVDAIGAFKRVFAETPDPAPKAKAAKPAAQPEAGKKPAAAAH
jgi:hypothetical protein